VFGPGDLSPTLDDTVNVGAYRGSSSTTVKRPIATEVLTIGDVYPITWDTSPRVVFRHFTIDLSTDGGSTWLPIADEVHFQDRVHEWEVVDDASADCLIRITGNRIAGGVSATSGTFTIAA